MESMSNKRLVIVGGVAGGASAAARARRLCEDCEIIIFERGPHVSFANCGLPYFVGGETLLLDVRRTDERAREFIPGSTHIPLDELRERLTELPREREIIAFA